MKYFLEVLNSYPNIVSPNLKWLFIWKKVRVYKDAKTAVKDFKKLSKNNFYEIRLRADHILKPKFVPLDTWTNISKEIAIKYLAILQQNGFLHDYLLEFYPELAGKTNGDDALFSLALRYKLI